jgi:glycyl-radical enzyme activating protein
MGISGIVTEIERYSVHDGPGIRSVVFLKGCQLRCLWCCNPETLEPFFEMGYFSDKCILCLKCIDDCPHGAIVADGESNLRTSRQICAARCYATTDSLPCTQRCFSGARKALGQRLTVEQVLAEVEKDHQLYERTGGGVTLSGGEVSFQPEYALSLLKSMKENWIDTAVETNGNGDPGFLERISAYVDFIFLDIKSLNEDKHRQWTGASNRRTLDAAIKLTEWAREGRFSLVIRTPVIPGLNDTPLDMREIGTFIKNELQNLPKWELLPYHRLGRNKYASLGKYYSLDGLEPFPLQGVRELESAIEDLHIEMVRY